MTLERLRGPAAGLLVAALIVGGIAWGGGSIDEPRADFVFCNQQEISSLDPAIATGSPEGRILRALFEGLTRLHPETLEPLPGMARSWSVSDDGRRWTFQMRPGCRWTNGDPVTAHDFAYSLRRLMHPMTGAAYANLLWVVVGGRALSSSEHPDDVAVGIEALSDDVLEMRLTAPCPYLPSLLAYIPLLPVHRGTLEAHGPDWVKVKNIVTNGPFRIVERRVRDRIRMVRNEDYWGAHEVQLGSVVALAASGNTTQLNLFLTGEVDWMVKPPTSLYGVLRPMPEAHVGTQLGMTFYRFNTERPPFDDPRVRRALALALDRRALAIDVMRGGEQPAASYVPPGLPGYAPASLDPPDPERARRLLADAGYPGGAGFPEFELLYPSNEMTRDFCEATATQWRRELGVHARLVNQTWKVYLDSTKQRLYDSCWGSWIGDYLDPSTFLDVFLADSGNNRTGWGDARYDELVTAAAGELDQTLREQLYRDAEAILLDQLPIAPVYQRMNFNMVSQRVSGFYNNLLDQHPLRDIAVHGPPQAVERHTP